jgi:hypothetical protein
MEFQWTDELVKEMLYAKLPLPPHYLCNVQKLLDEFKKSKQPNKEYEILSYKDNFAIHSVKRLSDGEIFTVRDKLDVGDISKFYLTNCGMSVICNDTGFLLNEVNKSKAPLFTTEDEVAITDENQTLYAVLTKAQWETREDTVKRMNERSQFSKPLNSAWKYFSTDEARSCYIIRNKPFLSWHEIFNLFRDNGSSTSKFLDAVYERSKSKI